MISRTIKDHLRWVLLCLCLGLCPAAQAAKDDFNVDCFFGWAGYVRSGEWTSLEISVINTALTEPFEGILHVEAPQDQINTLHLQHRVVVTAQMPAHVPLCTKLVVGMGQCKLALTDDRGRTRWQSPMTLYSQGSDQTLKSVGAADMLVGLLGKTTFGILQLKNDAVCRVRDDQQARQGLPDVKGLKGQVWVGDKIYRMMPWDWTGFESLDVLLLFDPDFSQLRPDQIKAMAQWLTNGGRILAVVGSQGWPSGSALGQCVPVQVDSPREMALSGEALGKLGLEQREGGRIVCSPVRSTAPRLTDMLVADEIEAGVFVTASVGFGRIGVLGLDPQALSNVPSEQQTQFWVTCLNAVIQDHAPEAAETRSRAPFNGRGPRQGQYYGQMSVRPADRVLEWTGPDRQPENPQQNPMYRHSFAESDRQATDRILEYLYNIEQMKPLDVWPVVGVLVLLAVLLGPVDYLVLKRLDRLPLTWVTSAAWITIFTVAAYYGVYALRSGSLRLRTVSLVDCIQGTDTAWACTYSGLFADRSGAYRYDGVGPDQWWSGLAPMADPYRYRQGLGGRDVFCEQQDGANRLIMLPVNLWTMQCTLTEQPVGPPQVRAEVTRIGQDLRVTVTNTGLAAIQRGYAFLGKDRGIELGPVRAGATQQFQGCTRPDNWLQTHTQPQGLLDATGSWRRTEGIEAYLDRGAAVIVVQMESPAAPFKVQGRDCQYDSIQWVRLIVWPAEN